MGLFELLHPKPSKIKPVTRNSLEAILTPDIGSFKKAFAFDFKHDDQ
jgi:hypothetical protein